MVRTAGSTLKGILSENVVDPSTPLRTCVFVDLVVFLWILGCFLAFFVENCEFFKV